MKKKLAILISGRGSNMLALIKACEAADFPAEVAVVISNKADAGGLDIAEKHGIATRVCSNRDFTDKAEFETALSGIINEYKVDMVCLAGFMRVLGPTYFNNIKVTTLNIHPSLLPKYKGLHTHEAVLANNDPVHGCSVHIATLELDGGEIILQRKINVFNGDTPDTLAQRLLHEEHRAYPEAVKKLLG